MLFADLMMLLADAVPPEAPARPPWADFIWVPFVLLFAWFFLIRGPMKQEQSRTSMIKSLKKDDEVLTNSGIYGSVVSVHETKDEVVLKVADNARIRVTKASVFRNISQEEAARAEAAKKSGK